ncbi:MAG: hypothetical protein IJN03_01980 [Bacilli bacterium]|nr:hypothetical protein [Bacilli bacterium]
MFAQNEKLTLTLINARDINGNILPFQLQLPISSEYSLPEGVASLDVFEYHEGLANFGNVAFTIYIGEVTTVNNLINTNAISKVKITNNLDISSVDSSICIQTVLGKSIVFANVKEQDVVVENIERLIEFIECLSNYFGVIDNSVKKIRILSSDNKADTFK